MPPSPSSVRDSDYLEGMLGLAYPFKDSYGSDDAFDALFADIVFCFQADRDAAVAAELDGFTLSGTFGSENLELVFTEGGRTYIASADEPDVEHTVERTDDWVTHSWRRSTPTNPFWISATFGRDEYENRLGETYSGMGLRLHDRCARSQPLKTRVLRVDGVEVDVSKPVQLAAGVGMVLAVAPVEGEARSLLTMSVDPTSTIGGNASCSDNVGVVRTINGVAPDEYGGFSFVADSCHWVTDLGSSSNPVAAQISIFNNCTPCIDCDDLFDAYAHLRRVNNIATSTRLRLCDLVTVYNDYVSLINLVDEDLKKFKIEAAFEQTDYEAYSVAFRLHVGPKAIKFISIEVEYTSLGNESALQPYSGREKLFGFASRQKLKVTSTPANPNTGVDFDGTYLEYDATSSLGMTALRRYAHAGWYWNMYLRDNAGTFGSELDVDITYRVNITFIDDTTYDSGDVTETVTIISQNGGSA